MIYADLVGAQIDVRGADFSFTTLRIGLYDTKLLLMDAQLHVLHELNHMIHFVVTADTLAADLRLKDGEEAFIVRNSVRVPIKEYVSRVRLVDVKGGKRFAVEGETYLKLAETASFNAALMESGKLLKLSDYLLVEVVCDTKT